MSTIVGTSLLPFPAAAQSNARVLPIPKSNRFAFILVVYSPHLLRYDKSFAGIKRDNQGFY